ncbi:MAG: DUF6326 family protein [Spirochaetales bacterium]|nr:DUF6326 family protein [Spirochaetales bacterium]
MKKQKIIISSLWVFVLINMMYADILSLMDSSSIIRNIMDGDPLPSGGLLAGAVLMESVIAMIFLSLVLPRKVNRIVTLVVSVVNIIAIITGGHGSYYVFFASVEIAAIISICILSWINIETASV